MMTTDGHSEAPDPLDAVRLLLRASAGRLTELTGFELPSPDGQHDEGMREP